MNKPDKTLTLWILAPRKGLQVDPWEPWYDKCFGLVVTASTEKEARKIAQDNRGDEGLDAWRDEKYSTCVELKPGTSPKLIIRDYASA